MNKLNKIISIDIPSGINGDTGRILGCAVKAHTTLALHAKKIGHTLNPGKKYSGKIKLLCFPRFFGYVFNPLSIFYCYDENSRLKAVLYEVKNTFNEQHTYVFSVSSSSNLILHKCDKKFYVSPFMEMKTFYNFRLLKPEKILNVFIKQQDAEGILFTACQVGKKIEMSSKNLFFQFLTHPLMSFKVILAIHFEAFRLWIKGVKHVKRKIKIKNNLSIEN